MRRKDIVLKRSLPDAWANAYNIRISITNNSDAVIHNWGLLCTTEDKILNLYNAIETEYEGNSHFFKNMGWNQDIPAGGSVTFGYTAEYGETPYTPTDFKIVSIPSEVESMRYRISFLVVQEWDTGAQAEILIENISNADIEDWSLEFDTELEITQIWNAQIVSHEGGHYLIRNTDDSQNIAAGETKIIGLLTDHGELSDGLDHIIMKEVTHEGLEISGGGASHDVPGLIEVDCSDLEMFSKDREIYWLDEVKTSLSGTLGSFEHAVSMNYIIADINDTVLSQGEMTAASDWNIPNIGFVVGANLICIEAVYDDGSIVRKELTIINYCEENMAAAGVELGDSDGDGICDYYERMLGLDPDSADSDGDSLTDMDEMFYTGTDPCNPDTDGDGIIDSEELVQQKIHQEIVTQGSALTDVSVDMLCAGDISRQVYIQDTYGIDKLSSDVAGLVGVPVEIISFTDFDSATVTFTYDTAGLGDTPEENLCMMWYDEENKTYQILEDSVVDTLNHTVSYTTTHFSTYLLVDKQIWYDTWRQNIDYSNMS